MSPTRKPHSTIKVQVPRHNSQRIGAKLGAEVESAARAQRIRVNISQPSYETSSTMALAIESASEWNSLLMTARAERGPQWDVGTQHFLVDEGSELYYDPTTLLEAQKKQQQTDEAERNSAQQPEYGGDRHMNSPHHRNPNPYSYASPGMANRYPGMAQPFSAVPPGQFYNSMDMGTPSRMGMNHDGMGMSPGVGRRVTRGMIDDTYSPYHGN